MEALEKAAKNGEEELLSEIFDQLEQKDRIVPKRILSTMLFTTVNECNSTAKIEGHVACLNTLISKGANINAEKSGGANILMLACSKGFLELVTEIMNQKSENGIFMHHCDKNDKNYLHYAIDTEAENLDIVKLLINEGININGQSINK